MAYWPGNVKNYRGQEEVEFLCRFCLKAFHTQPILDSHEGRCPAKPEKEHEDATRSFSTLKPVPPTPAADADAAPPAPPKNFITLKSGVQVKTVLVGSGGKVVKKIILRAAPSAKTMPSFPPNHTCAHCARSFARLDHLHLHLSSYHGDSEAGDADAAEGDIDVTTAESPEKALDPADAASSSAASAGLNWDELANKKVNYPIALKKIPIGKRTSGKFWRTPTLKSGLPLVLKVVGGSGMEELSEAHKPLFCSVCRFLFKTTREMREHVVKEHLDLNNDEDVQETDMLGLEDEEADLPEEDLPLDEAPVTPSPKKIVVRARKAPPKAGESSAERDAPPKLKFNCEECDVEFKSRENIVEHLRKVHRQKMMFQCGKCDKFFALKAKLARHEQMHAKMDSGPSAYTCEYCGKQFVYESYLRRHRSSHTGDKFYTCPTCGENFKSQGRLVIHKATAHEGGGGMASLYQCERCGKAFPYKSYLDRHVKTHIAEIPMNCTYPHCNQVFKVESSLKKHIVKEHEDRGLLSCPHCDKKFLYPSYLVRHQTVHTTSREHQCPMCNKQFSLRGTLLDHLKSHLPSSDDILPKSSTCMICNNKYRHESNLERHMQTMHPREWLDSLYEEVPDARFEETVITAPEEEEIRVEFIEAEEYGETA